MTPRELRSHKEALKILSVMPSFVPLKKGGLPKPFNSLGRYKRAFTSGMIELSETYAAMFIYRGGEILTDAAFYGYLYMNLPQGRHQILLEYHWHPSHKGLHCKTPCKTSLDYTDRLLAHAPELSLKPSSHIMDPRLGADREALIRLFCAACNVTIAPIEPEGQGKLL